MVKHENFAPGDLVRRRQLNFGGPAFAEVALTDVGVFIRSIGSHLFEDRDQVCEVLFQNKSVTERLMMSSLEKFSK